MWVRSLGWEDPLEKEMAATPVLLPGESHGGRSLIGYSPWGGKELDTTERLHFTVHNYWFVVVVTTVRTFKTTLTATFNYIIQYF